MFCGATNRNIFSVFHPRDQHATVALVGPIETMALAEISNNIAGRMRTTGRSAQSPRNGTCLTSNFWAERKADFKPPPSSLQGMLKNTTESGDVGQFSIKPTRIPYPTTHRASHRRKNFDTRASPRSAALTSFQPRPEQYRESEHGSEEYIPFRPYRGTAASSVISLYQGESQKSLYSPSQTADQDYPSYPVTQGSRISYKVSDQRSLASLRAQCERTRSPLAYPTRLKRPGYRPSSPALSDFNGSEARTNFGLDRGTSSRTSSPLSMHAKDRIPSHRRGFSRSIPSLVNPPSAFIPRLDRAQQNASAPTRVLTPTPLVYQQSARAATQDQWARSVPSLPTRSRRSPSATPLYYDYTEAFEEESHFHSTTVSMDSLVDRPISEDRPVHYELDAKVDHDPIELAVRGSVSPDSSVEIIYSANGDLPVDGTRCMPMQALDNHEIEAPPSVEGCPSDIRSQQPAPSANVDEDESEEEHPALSELSTKNVAVGCSTFPDDTCGGGMPASISSNTARGMLSSNNFLQSSHQSCPATNSLELSFSKAEDAHKERHSIGDVSQAQCNLPSQDFSHLDLNGRTTRTSHTYGTHVLSSDGLVETNYASIYAPVPERTLSTRSHQNKYSRILSIDENFSELAELVAKSEVADRLRTSDQTREDSRSAEPALNYSGASSSVRPLSELAGHSSAATGSLASADTITLPERDEDQQRILSELIRQSLLWEYSHSTASSGGTENFDDGIVPQHTLQDSFSKAPAGNPTQTLPAPIGDSAIVSAHHQILASQDNDRLGVVKKKSHTEFMKRLPLLPRNSSYRSFTPPNPSRSTQLPFAFSPLVASRKEIALDANRETSLTALTERQGHKDEEEESLVPRYKLKMRPNRDSSASPADPRPWNFDASYPWNNQPSQIDLRLPEPSRLHPQPVAKSPRFKLKITRASLLNEGTVRIRRQAASPKTDTTHQAPKPIDLFRSLTFGRRGKSGLPEMGTASNGSLSKKMQLSIAVDGRASTFGNANLIPPLSALQFTETRSFFSDDSSQKLRKGSLRKRLSYLKAIATRNSSSEERKGVDRGLAGSAMGKSRASGRSSQHSTGPTVGISNLKYVKWKMVERIKGWWQRGEEKIRALGEMVKGKGHKSRSQNTDLYQGA